MTRTAIATILATVLGAGLAVAQTSPSTKPATPATPATPSTSATSKPATPSTAATPSTTAPPAASTSTPSSARAPSNSYTTEADAKSHCGTDTVVWANTGHSHVYHLSGDKYYGHTHHGAYMCMKDAVAAGYHAPGSKSKSSTSTTHS